MFRLRLPSLALPFLLLTMAPALDAQTAYRCEDDGRVVFSDKPCPGGTPVDTRPATGSTSTTPPRSAAPTSAPPATPPAVPAPKPATVGTAPAKTTPAKPEPTKAAAPVGPGYQTREQACAEGSQKACDEIACLRDDTEACARIGGSVRGSGWYEIARKRETRSGKNDRGQTTLQRVLVLTIRCTGPQQRSGDIALGRGTITLANSSVNYSSVDTAAAALCKR